MGTSTEHPKPASSWRTVLRPLIWWGVLVVLLFLIRTHQRLSSQTRLLFSVQLPAPLSSYEAVAQLDGHPVSPGDQLSIGFHTIRVSHPKTVAFEINRFFWYGEHDMGTIRLERATGTLVIQAVPAARQLRITGPEFSLKLDNSSGLTSSVPTDTYGVEANYANFHYHTQLPVSSGTAPLLIAPKLGATIIEANRDETGYELSSVSGQVVKMGSLPVTLLELPVGQYKLDTKHNMSRRVQTLAILEGTTNTVQVNFAYGAVIIDTDPPDAWVLAPDGTHLGQTPIQFLELEPGDFTCTLKREGFEPMRLSVPINASETNTVRTNLVNAIYAASMANARRYSSITNLEAALLAVKDALRAQPGDTEATGMLNDLSTQLQKEQARSQRAARVRRIREYFNELMQATLHAGLFEDQEVNVRGKLDDVRRGLVSAFVNKPPIFTLSTQDGPNPQITFLQATQSLETAGWRRCDLVVGKAGEDEVTLIFKVFEYAYPKQFTSQSAAAPGDERKMVPIHSSRLGAADTSLLKRREEGVALLRAKIRQATSVVKEP